jgi:hypothetical protein
LRRFLNESVISGHHVFKSQCPLYLGKQTSELGRVTKTAGPSPEIIKTAVSLNYGLGLVVVYLPLEAARVFRTEENGDVP